MNKLKNILKPTTQEGKVLKKKIVANSIMGILFIIIIMWLIFSLKKEDEDKEEGNFNTEMPTPTTKKMIDDKLSSYTQFKTKERNNRDDIRDISNSLTSNSDERFNIGVSSSSMNQRNNNSQIEKIKSSASAYKDMNNSLKNFYVKPDIEKQNMKAAIKRLEDKNAELARQKLLEKTKMDDPLALLEKSYELAAKYNAPKKEKPLPIAPKEDKPIAVPVSSVTHNIVSSITGQTSSRGFITAIGKEKTKQRRNTIIACVHNKQTITNGKSVRLRLLEAIQVGTVIVPKNSLITGVANIRGDRLDIDITSIEHDRLIIPIELTVYDIDGQEGIYIPNSMEVNALKDITANIGENLGTSISITNQSAGGQLLTELGKDIIEGTSQYISNKIRVVKVTLKPDYKIMLFQKRD